MLLMRFPSTSRSTPPGFTLIELLAVIAIIGILAALAIPLLRGLLAKSFRAQSMNNLRQLYTACVQYANDNDMYMVNAFVAADPDLGRAQSSWRHQLVEGGYLGAPDQGSVTPMNYKVMGSPVQWNEARSYTIGKNPPVYATYGMNSRLSMINVLNPSPVKVTSLLQPSRTLFLSEGWRAADSQFFNVGVSPWGATPNHTDGTVRVVYADGHVGQMTDEEFPKTEGAVGSDTWYFWRGRN